MRSENEARDLHVLINASCGVAFMLLYLSFLIIRIWIARKDQEKMEDPDAPPDLDHKGSKLGLDRDSKDKHSNTNILPGEASLLGLNRHKSTKSKRIPDNPITPKQKSQKISKLQPIKATDSPLKKITIPAMKTD